MKQKLVLIASILASMYGGASNTSAQWVATKGSYGGKIQALTVCGMTIFAGTDGSGVFSSSNNGSNWVSVNDGLVGSSLIVYSLVVMGKELYAGTYGGVFCSTDKGTTWSEAGLKGYDVQALIVSGLNIFAGTVTAGSTKGGVFLSTNAGLSWTPVNSGLTNLNVGALLARDANLYAGTNGNGVFLSTNNGTTWAAADSGMMNASIWSLAESGRNLFAGTYDHGIYFSANDGAGWKWMTDNFPRHTSVYAIAISGNNIFSGTEHGVFLSTDNGASWNTANDGLPPKTNVASLVIIGKSLFAGTNSGVFRTSIKKLVSSYIDGSKGQSKISAKTSSSNDRMIKLGGIVPCRVRVENNFTYLYLKGTRTTVTKVSNGLTIFKEFDATLPTQPQISANQFDWTKELVGKEVTKEAGENIEPLCEGSSLVGESSCVWRYSTNNGNIAVSVTKKSSFGKDFQYIWENESFSAALEAEKNKSLLK